MKVAIVHDYFHQYGGAEKVVEEWLEMYPDADIFTSFFVADKFTSSNTIHNVLLNNNVVTSIAQKLFHSTSSLKFFKHFFWLYPVAMSFVKVKDYDVVLISSTNPAKNVQVENCGKIIHYCHSPTRYLYLLDRETDLNTINPVLRVMLPLFTWWLRYIDQRAAQYLTAKGTQWVANSSYTALNIKKIYNVESNIIYPPVNTDRFKDVVRKPLNDNPFYFYFGRISFHKKTQLTVKACLQSHRRLIVAGSAAFTPELDKLKDIVAKHEEAHPEDKGLVEFRGRLPYSDIQELLAQCSGYIFPGVEDFGIIQIEVLASGTPVIGIRGGGHKEYIEEGVNGILFDEQTPESIIAALDISEQTSWSSKTIRASAQAYSQKHFRKNINTLIS